MKTLIGFLLILVGIAGGLYLFFWWGIVQPIIDIGNALRVNPVDTEAIAFAVLQFFLRDLVAIIWGAFFCGLGSTMMD